MKMKKLILILICGVICGSFAACTDKADKTETSSAAESNVVSEQTESSADTVQSAEGESSAEDIKFTLDDNDPHKSKEEKIIKKTLEILDDDEFKEATLNVVEETFKTELTQYLKENNIDYNFIFTNTGLRGKFSDDWEFNFEFTDIYKDHSYEKLAKTSDNDKDKEMLNGVIAAIKEELAKNKDEQKISSYTTEDIIDRVMWVWIHYHVDEQYEGEMIIRWDGVKGVFLDGTKWGYSYEELKRQITD